MPETQLPTIIEDHHGPLAVLPDNSFYGIEREVEAEIAELYAYRDECETDEERAAVDKAIREYVNPKEVKKIDGLRSFMKHCRTMIHAAREERELQDARAKAWEARLDWLKQYVLGVAEALGKKRFDGKTGYLLVKGNGGVQALTITDESLVPDEFCEVTVTMSIQAWQATLSKVKGTFPTRVTEQRCVRSDLVRKALSEPCPGCDGKGKIIQGTNTCPACGGEGTRRVPGARLESRGVHLEVK